MARKGDQEFSRDAAAVQCGMLLKSKMRITLLRRKKLRAQPINPTLGLTQRDRMFAT
jgi:hypothetical protein